MRPSTIISLVIGMFLGVQLQNWKGCPNVEATQGFREGPAHLRRYALLHRPPWAEVHGLPRLQAAD